MSLSCFGWSNTTKKNDYRLDIQAIVANSLASPSLHFLFLFLHFAKVPDLSTCHSGYKQGNSQANESSSNDVSMVMLILDSNNELMSDVRYRWIEIQQLTSETRDIQVCHARIKQVNWTKVFTMRLLEAGRNLASM